MVVIEIVSRCAKLLIRDGLAVLAETEASPGDLVQSDGKEGKQSKYTSQNVKKLILHYIHQIFSFENVETGAAATTIWDFLTEHSRRKFFLSIDRDVLTKVHLNSLLANILLKLNIKLSKSIDEIDFAANGGKFLTIEDIVFIGPTVKDYSDVSLPVLSGQDHTPFSLSYVLELAREKDTAGRRSQWYMKGGPERAIATNIYTVAVQIAERVFTTKSV